MESFQMIINCICTAFALCTLRCISKICQTRHGSAFDFVRNILQFAHSIMRKPCSHSQISSPNQIMSDPVIFKLLQLYSHFNFTNSLSLHAHIKSLFHPKLKSQPYGCQYFIRHMVKTYKYYTYGCVQIDLTKIAHVYNRRITAY